MILIIDNFDSFTYNLVQRLGEIDATVEVRVLRNNEATVDEIAEMTPERIIISPGPCTPTEAGVSCGVAQRFVGKVPLLGVCLGHQAMAQAFGGVIVRARDLMHGKTDSIMHDGLGEFAGLPNPFVATRYHSLAVDPASPLAGFVVSAWCESQSGDREIMAIRHESGRAFGWQFHPESFLTECGPKLLKSFLQV